MMKINAVSKVKRIAIFVFYDSDGIVDEYVEYLLDDMMLNVDKLIIVVNGGVCDKGMSVLRKYSKNIYVRENIGFDVEAYKLVLLNSLFIKEAQNYDELVLFNDTFYGPLYPFKRVFSEMMERDIDFWGLTEHYKTKVKRKFRTSLLINRHIQTYFIVFRSSLFLDKRFYEFFNNIKASGNVSKVIKRFELQLTLQFESFGFVGDVYVDTKDLESDDLLLNTNLYITDALNLLSSKGLNVLKKRALNYNHLDYEQFLISKKLIEIIEKNFSYDINLILQNLERKKGNK